MEEARSERAREALDLAYRMANLLNTGLDRPRIVVLMVLKEQSVNSKVLVTVVKELHCKATALRSAASSSSASIAPS
ncbi:hypothetical protein L7F22_054360 [Adiantum nelumboides]|nr:hypothetical protein [Adiantum nelumboides]